jgi:thiol-disulfide isomerase/thioredoxin
MQRILACAGLLAVVALASRAADEPAKTVAVSEVKFDELDKAIADKKGKVVVVDFWATWCAPCVKKFPHFVELHKKYKDKGLAFLQKQEADFPNYIIADPDADEKKLTERFGKEGGIPFIAVFGKDGKKVWDSEQKKLKDEELVTLIEKELAK